jgi:uncharacterized protein DUF4333
MTMSIRHSLSAVGACAAIAAVASGCGDTVIDTAGTEDTIQQNLERSLDRKVASVDCPSDQAVDPGTTFSCTVRYKDGSQATATLKIRNEDADLSLISLEPDK